MTLQKFPDNKEPSSKFTWKFDKDVQIKFKDLFDTIDSYVGKGGYYLKVNDTEDGITVSAVALESDKNYVYEQTIASDIWTVEHNLGKFPAVEIIDSVGVIMIGIVEYIDNNNLSISFDYELTGKVICN